MSLVWGHGLRYLISLTVTYVGALPGGSVGHWWGWWSNETVWVHRCPDARRRSADLTRSKEQKNPKNVIFCILNFSKPHRLFSVPWSLAASAVLGCSWRKCHAAWWSSPPIGWAQPPSGQTVSGRSLWLWSPHWMAWLYWVHTKHAMCLYLIK